MLLKNLLAVLKLPNSLRLIHTVNKYLKNIGLTFLSMMTSRHLQQNLFNTTSYAGASHASQFHRQGQGRALQKLQNLVCGFNSSEPYAWFYECEWATFPASYLGAAHQRDRWYMLGVSTDTNSIRYRGGSSERCAVQERQLLQREQRGGKMGGKIERRGINNFEWRNTGHRLNPNWREYDVEPTIQRASDGLSSRLDKSRIHALGNSLVPQCAAIPLQRVLDLENESQT